MHRGLSGPATPVFRSVYQTQGHVFAGLVQRKTTVQCIKAGVKKNHGVLKCSKYYLPKMNEKMIPSILLAFFCGLTKVSKKDHSHC